MSATCFLPQLLPLDSTRRRDSTRKRHLDLCLNCGSNHRLYDRILPRELDKSYTHNTGYSGLLAPGPAGRMHVLLDRTVSADSPGCPAPKEKTVRS